MDAAWRIITGRILRSQEEEAQVRESSRHAAATTLLNIGVIYIYNKECYIQTFVSLHVYFFCQIHSSPFKGVQSFVLYLLLEGKLFYGF